MIKIKKRISSGYIKQSFEDRSHLSKERPPGSLTGKLSKRSGRDASGKISVRHRGGGVKRIYRIISTLDEYFGQEAEVLRLEYDPNRSADIALVSLKDGRRRYIIAPEGLRAGAKIVCSDAPPIETGNRAKLKNIPVGTEVFDVQTRPQAKKFYVRSAGTSAKLMAHDSTYALLRLPSGELRKIHMESFASIGKASNPEHANIRIGKAGRKRKMGIRPTVRGKAMHPGAHPHGGGEGVNPIGLKHPKTPWGKVAMGKKTRRSKPSDKFIIKKAKRKGR